MTHAEYKGVSLNRIRFEEQKNRIELSTIKDASTTMKGGTVSTRK